MSYLNSYTHKAPEPYRRPTDPQPNPPPTPPEPRIDWLVAALVSVLVVGTAVVGRTC